MKRTLEIDLEYQHGIESIPARYGDAYKIACSGDAETIKSWRETWIKNYKASKDRFGEFGSRSYGQLYGTNRHRPSIIIGSGPSLKTSIEALQENKRQPNPIKSISCLHNFGYFEDHACHADYYLTLDAGEIVLDDMYEGCSKDPAFYWEQTKDHTLIANVCTPPSLFDKWQGKVLLFNALMPDQSLRNEFEKIERLSHYISTGGNALGGCMYTAKALMGSSEIIYVGADFCFGHDLKFHSYKTKYDNFEGKGLGNTLKWPDVYGLPRKTWPSYFNFCMWFNWVSLNVPGRWVSCSEGILGSFQEGNLTSFRYGSLESVLETYRIADIAMLGKFVTQDGRVCQVVDEKGKPEKDEFKLSEFWKDSKQPLDLTLF